MSAKLEKGGTSAHFTTVILYVTLSSDSAPFSKLTLVARPLNSSAGTCCLHLRGHIRSPRNPMCAVHMQRDSPLSGLACIQPTLHPGDGLPVWDIPEGALVDPRDVMHKDLAEFYLQAAVAAKVSRSTAFYRLHGFRSCEISNVNVLWVSETGERELALPAVSCGSSAPSSQGCMVDGLAAKACQT